LVLSEERDVVAASSSPATGGGGTVSEWDDIQGKPFSSLGSGVKSESDALTVEPTDFAGTGLTDEGSDDLGISDGGVDIQQLATDAVTRDKIGDKAVGTVQIGLNAVTKTRVKDGQTFPIDISGDADTVDSYDAPALVPDGGANIVVGTLPSPTIAVSPQGAGSGLHADTLDGYEGSDLAALAEDETVTGRYTFDDEIQADLGLTSGDDLMPDQGYAHSIGSSSDKWLTLDVAELRVSTLVAEKELATVGGRQLVGTANELTSALASGDTVMEVKYNNLEWGDICRFEGDGAVEFVEVGAWPIVSTDLSGDVITVSGDRSGAISAGDTFYDDTLGTLTVSSVYYNSQNSETDITVQEDIRQSAGGIVYIERSGGYEHVSIARDLDGTGANSWDEGDGLFSTSQGEGFIDLYAEHSFTDASQSTIAGPTIAFREKGTGGYADVSERAAVGNLHDTYGYTSDVFGIAAGDPSGNHFTADPADGIRFIDGQTDTVTAQLSSQVFSVGPDKDLKYDADTDILSAGGWEIGSNTITSDPRTNGGGLTLAHDVQRSASNPPTQSYVCVHDSNKDIFTSLYYAADDSFGLVVEENDTKKVHFGDEMMLEGDLLVDGSVTANEVKTNSVLANQILANSAEISENLTMVGSGKITDDATPINYRIGSDGLELRAYQSTSVPAREITWLEPDLSGEVRGEIYTHNYEMNLNSYRKIGAVGVQTQITAYDRPKPDTGKEFARIRLEADKFDEHRARVIMTGSKAKFTIGDGAPVFDFRPGDKSMGFKEVHNYDSEPGSDPFIPDKGIKIYAKEKNTSSEEPVLWFLTENNNEYRVDVTQVN
jgi:hypothetical protein